MDQAKKIINKLSLFLPILGIMVIMNAVVDPAHLYLSNRNNNFENGIAGILASGHNVGNVHNFNDDLVKKFLIAKEYELPDIMVLGSSRSMEIGTNIFLDKHVLNNSVPGASLADYLGILFNYEKKGGFPKTIILGIDPWVLNPKNDYNGWISIKEDTFAMLKELGVPGGRYFKTPLFSPRMTNLFSFSYFQTAIGSWFKEGSLGDAYFSTDKETADNYDIELKDGRRSYSKSFRSRSKEEVEKLAMQDLTAGSGEGYNFQKPDRELSDILEKLISYLQSKHIEVVFYLPPYHPVVYRSFLQSDHEKVIIEIEGYYRDFAIRHKLKVLGSYDPSKAGLKEEDFYDDIHASKEGVEQIFRQGW